MIGQACIAVTGVMYILQGKSWGRYAEFVVSLRGHHGLLLPAILLTRR